LFLKLVLVLNTVTSKVLKRKPEIVETVKIFPNISVHTFKNSFLVVDRARKNNSYRVKSIIRF
jgi:hypothetical protein